MPEDEYDEFVEEDYYAILEALEKGFVVDIVIGPRPLADERRVLLKGLLEKYPDRFTCHVVKKRPIRHFTLIQSDQEIGPGLAARFLRWLVDEVKKDFDITIWEFNDGSPEMRTRFDLMAEDRHPAGEPYDSALCVEDANPNFAVLYKNDFDRSKNRGVLLTLANVDVL